MSNDDASTPIHQLDVGSLGDGIYTIRVRAGKVFLHPGGGILLQEASDTDSDVPLNTPVGTIIVRKA